MTHNKRVRGLNATYKSNKQNECIDLVLIIYALGNLVSMLVCMYSYVVG